MNKFKKIILLPISLFGILLLLGSYYASFLLQDTLLTYWMLIWGGVCILSAYPLSTRKFNLWWQFTVMLIFPLVVLSYLRYYKYTEEQAFICLIPAGYMGKVIIKYGQKNGKKAVFERNKMLLEVNANGMLETQHRLDKNINLSESEYYYITPNHERIVIAEASLDTTRLQVMNPTFYATDHSSFQIFYVGIPAEKTPSSF